MDPTHPHPGGAGGPYFMSFLRNSHKCKYVFINTHYCVFRRLFSRKKPPEAAHLPNNRGLFLGPRFLCMHKILVHAQHSCVCTTLMCMHWRGQGPRPGPQKKQPLVRPGATVFLLGPGLGPWTLQCMHKSVVHAQEWCACTRCARILTNQPLC